MKLSEIKGNIEGFWIVGDSNSTQIFGGGGLKEAIQEFGRLRRAGCHPRFLVDVDDLLQEVGEPEG